MTRPHRRRLVIAGAAAVLLTGALAVPSLYLTGADHLDPPARTNPAVATNADIAADIADVFAWHTDTSVVLALTFAGPQAATMPAVYDRDVLYTINLSNAAPRTTPDLPIEIRFGTGAGPMDFGVKVSGLPGGTEISGPVEQDLAADGIKVRAGLFDDPFFFDLQGFQETLNTGTLSFDSTRDFFAGQNLTAVVIEIPRNRIANGANPIDVWATTARIGGMQ